MLETDFGIFYNNVVTGETAQQVFEAWRAKMCVEENGVWRRKTDEELEQIDIYREKTTEEKILDLMSEYNDVQARTSALEAALLGALDV